MKFIVACAILLVVTFSATAQFHPANLNPLDTLGYQLSVVSKVKDIVAIAGISPQKQLTLAEFFKKEESTLTNALNTNSTPLQLQALQKQLIDEFQAILTPQELAAFSARRKDSIYARAATVTY
ncbi:hypothetical protein GCM10027037_26780 [Mucilaginibacter koreensis]